MFKKFGFVFGLLLFVLNVDAVPPESFAPSNAFGFLIRIFGGLSLGTISGLELVFIFIAVVILSLFLLLPFLYVGSLVLLSIWRAIT